MLKQCIKGFLVLFIFSFLIACSGSPQKPVIIIEKNVDNAQPVLTDAEKASYQEALALLAQDKLSEAESLFNELVKAQPRLTGAIVNLGVIKKKEDKIGEAKDLFLKALDINPNFIDALLQQSLVYRDIGEFVKAEDLLRRADAIQPNHPLVNYNLGVLYELYLQEYSLAIKYYERYVSVSKEDDVETVKRWIQLLERK